MEHSPVTTNPLIIMMINMTVVFIVLVVLMYLIKLIHLVDPTKPKAAQPAQESDDEEPLVAVKSAPAAPPLPEPVVEEGISPEVIAAITAAISAYGFSGQVKAVHIVNHENTSWHNSMRNAQFVTRNGRR